MEFVFKKSLHISPLVSLPVHRPHSLSCCHRSLTVCSQRLPGLGGKLVLTGHLLSFKQRFDHRPQLLLTSTVWRVGNGEMFRIPNCCTEDVYLWICVVSVLLFTANQAAVLWAFGTTVWRELVATRALKYGRLVYADDCHKWTGKWTALV